MVCLQRIIFTLVLDYDETILIVFFYMNTRPLQNMVL